MEAFNKPPTLSEVYYTHGIDLVLLSRDPLLIIVQGQPAVSTAQYLERRQDMMPVTRALLALLEVDT
jgi:hypothetical protein